MLKKIMILSALLAVTAGCKKETVQQNTTSQELYTSGGFIQGTVSGIRANGVSFSIPFEYKYYFQQDRLKLSETTGYYTTNIDRYPSGNPSKTGYCSLSFSLYSTTYPYGLDETNFSCDIIGTVANGTDFEFTAYFSNNGFSNSSFTINNFSYNAATRVASGNFNALIDAADNLTGYPATIAGSFQSAPMILTLTKSTNNHQSPAAKSN